MRLVCWSIAALALMAFGLGWTVFVTQPDDLYTFHYENVLGTSFELKVNASSPEEAGQAESAALAEIDRQAGILSAYDPQSEFSRWLATSGEAALVSQELYEVLDLFDQWRERTGGALDPSAEVVSRLWTQAAAEQRLPSPAELAEAVESVQQPHWRLDPATRTATHLSDAPLALNSFVKSYIADRASAAALAVEGVRSAVVNIGGDLVVRGDRTETVQIADPLSTVDNSAPLATLLVRDRTVATSGNYHRGVEIGGRHYSHIVDPRTALPVDHVISATVIAPDPADAGALATAFSVMDVEESRRLAATLPEVEYLLVTNDGRQVTSSGWDDLEALAESSPKRPSSPSGSFYALAAEPASALWDPSFELLVTVELGRINDPRYRRPFIAVWIEDADRFPVRTVALWFDRDQWLPDLKSWYRADRIRALAEGKEIAYSVSSATRPPGTYTVRWDGKDNDGKLVKAGTYTVCVESSREHGGYEVYRQEMDFSGVPKEIEIAGQIEIPSVSLSYNKLADR